MIWPLTLGIPCHCVFCSFWRFSPPHIWRDKGWELLQEGIILPRQLLKDQPYFLELNGRKHHWSRILIPLPRSFKDMKSEKVIMLQKMQCGEVRILWEHVRFNKYCKFQLYVWILSSFLNMFLSRKLAERSEYRGWAQWICSRWHQDRFLQEAATQSEYIAALISRKSCQWGFSLSGNSYPPLQFWGLLWFLTVHKEIDKVFRVDPQIQLNWK